MKYKISDFFTKARSIFGDTSNDCPEEFLMNALNWTFNELPTIPKLNKLFSDHITANLSEKEYRWKLNEGFRSINDIQFLHFYTSKGGEPCRARVCNKSNADFYAQNGLIERKQPGQPCSYTIEYEGDDCFLVVDRPLGIPMIVDYSVTGYPKPVKSTDEEREISAIAENLILALMRKVWYEEADDFAFSGAVEQYLDNKLILEATQQLNKRYKNETPRVLGGA